MSYKKESTGTVILTPANISSTFTKRINLSRDLKNLLKSLNADVKITLNASGEAKSIALFQNNYGGQDIFIADGTQLEQMGAVRRFTTSIIKDTEKVTATEEKFSLLESLKDSVKVNHLSPDANGRYAELLRISKNVSANRKAAEEWYEEDIDRTSKQLVLVMCDRVQNVLREETKSLLAGKKVEKDFAKNSFARKNDPIWFYETLTTAGAITSSTEEPLDYLFPKNNVLKGFFLKTYEIRNTDLINKFSLLTMGNTFFLKCIMKMVELVPDADYQDNQTTVSKRIDETKWNLVPFLGTKDMVNRYKNGKVRAETLKFPEGEAGIILAKYLNEFGKFNAGWNQVHRFIMYDEQDIEGFWKLLTDTSKWSITKMNGTRYWVNLALDENAIDVNLKLQRELALYFIASKIGMYNPNVIDNWISSVVAADWTDASNHDYDLEKKIEEFKTKMEELDKRKVDYKTKLDSNTDDYGGVDYKADMDSLKNEQESLRATVVTGVHLGRLGAVENEITYDLIGIDSGEFHREFKEDKSAYAGYPETGAKTNETLKETREKYVNLFGKKEKKKIKKTATAAFTSKLTKETRVILKEMASEGEYGRSLSVKVENWLHNATTGAPQLEILAIRTIANFIKDEETLFNKNHYTDSDDEDDYSTEYGD